MATNAQLDFLKIKVFLYKYNPPFTLVNTSTDTTFQKTQQYDFPLSEDHFSIINISDFVGGYTVEQDIGQGTIQWSLTLRDTSLTSSELRENYLLKGPGVSTLLQNIAQTEAQSSDITTETETILQAKLSRGNISYTDLEERTITKTPTNGLTANWSGNIRLSDLIQPYDIISCFFYKGDKPLEEVTGTVALDGLNNTNTLIFTPSKTGRKLTPQELNTESILLSIPGVSNEFNGYVLTKALSSTAGGVDTISLTGISITRLFGATRRLMKGDIGGQSIYTTEQIGSAEAFTPYQNVFADKSILGIITDLFKTVFRITLNSDGSSSLYDITAFEVGHARHTNLFTIPAYLLALVMKRRGFKFKQSRSGALPSILAEISSTSAVDVTPLLSSSTLSLQTVSLSTKIPVKFSSDINTLRAYLLQIEQAFTFFNPQTQTPFEILDEIKSKAFIEIFEDNEGVVHVRAPQYNDLINIATTDDIQVITSTYSSTITDLVTKQRLGYSPDITPVPDPAATFFYTNGKLFAQYGWFEGEVDKNPNFTTDKTTNTNLAQKKYAGLFSYAEYFLRIYNASLSTATITAVYDKQIQVGKTFFDKKNNKFGYIKAISKQIGVGQPAIVTFLLTFVRDAYQDASGNIHVEQLKRLLDINNAFT